MLTLTLRSLRWCGAPTGQPHGELGKLADLALNLDRPAMLLRDDVVADREAQPGALSGRLGGDEGLEQLVAHLRRDAGAVVAHLDLDRLAEIAGGDADGRRITGTAFGPVSLARRVEAVAEQIEQHPRHLLRHDLDGF